MPSNRLNSIPLDESIGKTNRNHLVKKRGTRKNRKMPKQRARVKVRPMVQALGSFSSSKA
jgi:hypothetical protein